MWLNVNCDASNFKRLIHTLFIRLMGFDHLKPVILLRFAGLLSPKPCFWFQLNVNVIDFILNNIFVSR